MKNILLLVDPLNDFADKNGSLYVPNGEKVILNINKIMNENDFDDIILIQDWHPKTHKSFAINNNKELYDIIDLNGIKQVMWPSHCVVDTWGAQPHSLLEKKWFYVVRKGIHENVDSYSAFFENDKKTRTEIFNVFEKLHVNKTDNIHIVGLATEYCVKYTALDAKKFFNNVIVHENGIAGINKNDIEKAINEMKNNDIKFI